jgi:hypothetical protein
MRYIDVFAELAAEVTGKDKADILAKMMEYEKTIESNPVIYKEMSNEKAQALRDRVHSDPAGFLRWALKGFGIEME